MAARLANFDAPNRQASRPNYFVRTYWNRLDSSSLILGSRCWYAARRPEIQGYVELIRLPACVTSPMRVEMRLHFEHDPDT
jgi:hypothetical protein